ncbi:MAG TPA: hypothetical protein VGX22_11130, partial [Candidatus Dormibacteraeota bacterium]|nr:hypothetical protein [Candidatus Dormibacteraeota bacterium]
MSTAGFNATTDGGVQHYGDAEAAAGMTGMVWVDAYDHTNCVQTMSDAAISAIVQANVSAGHSGLRYEIGDEPTTSGCNAAPTYAHMTAVVHSADASARTWVADNQFQVGKPIQIGISMKGAVDLLAFDVYPCNTGPCNYTAIDLAVQQIHAAQVSNWEFIIQDFNTSPARWPTAAEIQGQFDHWKGQGAIGYWVFAWDYLGQQVITQSGNVAALQQINSEDPTSPGISTEPIAATSTSALALEHSSSDKVAYLHDGSILVGYYDGMAGIVDQVKNPSTSPAAVPVQTMTGDDVTLYTSPGATSTDIWIQAANMHLGAAPPLEQIQHGVYDGANFTWDPATPIPGAISPGRLDPSLTWTGKWLTASWWDNEGVPDSDNVFVNWTADKTGRTGWLPTAIRLTATGQNMLQVSIRHSVKLGATIAVYGGHSRVF